jgi:hypothetical protein
MLEEIGTAVAETRPNERKQQEERNKDWTMNVQIIATNK